MIAGITTTQVATVEEWSFPPSTATIVQEGQMWFNSSSSTLKGYGTAAGITSGTWSAGGNLNTPRERWGGTTSTGGTTAALGAGGDSPVIASVEQYDGTSWTETTDLNTARGVSGGGSGTTTATLVFAGGAPPPSPVVTNNESFNGSAWTELTDVNTGRTESKGGGTQTAALLYPGYVPPPSTARNNFEEWDGSSWTELADINRARSGIGAGTTSPSSAVIFAGSNPPPVPSPTPAETSTETWNGTSWTEVNNLNTGRNGIMSFGTATSCIGAGKDSSEGLVEYWNGTSWTEINELGTFRNGGGGSGTSVAGLVFAGNPQPGAGTATEEFVAAAAISTITTSQLTF